MNTTNCLLTYGSLMCDEVMTEVSGASFDCQPANLTGYQRFAIKNEHYPALIVEPDQQVGGVLYCGITETAWQRLDRFEGEQYQRQAVTVELADGSQVEAQCYIWKAEFNDLLEDYAWDYQQFLESGKQAFQQQYKGYGDLIE
ncbi:gamma-glutamylcyclotransferase family protein [Thiomicrorhabdus sediminis]|uniref:Putative gamma-glutamylcyclotransferase n=1 Tax=Thiomicrorhabdus sediminis TaxID=2580412 RepID=A0A4V1HHV1_9GAMM|nr:gamma-glutamylcyclotransferase family protein [Thiomicrorhabdus sediminis]QCU90303.1 gamma-glutamylcyclotransferase [Thiomicrorhabdus sediminis]